MFTHGSLSLTGEAPATMRALEAGLYTSSDTVWRPLCDGQGVRRFVKCCPGNFHGQDTQQKASSHILVPLSGIRTAMSIVS